MTDLRSLLDLAAGDPPPPLPIALVRRRAASRTRRRRTGTVAALVAVAAALGVVAPRLAVHRALPAHLGPPQISQGRLAAGTYMATVVGQAVSVTVPADVKWTAIRVDALALALLEQPDLVQVKVVTWTAVHRYTAEGVAQTTTDPVPDDLMSWLSHHPGVLVTAPSTTTTLAGQPAHTIRITMDYRYNPADPAAGPAVGCSSSAECIALADTSDGVVALYSTSDMTIAAQDRSDNHRLVAVTLNHTNPGVPAPVIR